MSVSNPYEKYLDGRPLELILAETSGLIAEHLEVLGHRQNEKPGPGKWSAAEIICHLADCEIVFAFRLRQTLAEDHHMVQPFDQDVWAREYAGIKATSALETFTAVRHWNLHLIKASLPAHADKPVSHPERGAMTFRTLVETMAGHDLNHLGQLTRLAG